MVTLAALACSLAFAQTPAGRPASAASGVAASPIVGTWSWTLPGKNCTETWRFRADGARHSTSGEEDVRGSYKLSATPSAKNFYRLSETVTRSNEKRDCAGDLHGSSDAELLRFIQFSPTKDQIIVCMEESLNACFGPLKKMDW